MKKIIAIPLIAVYLFNLIGYSLYTNYFIAQADKKIIQQIDNNSIDEQLLIEIKTPVSIPYYNNSKEYQRMDGEFVLHGVHYNYVKRKIQNDTLYLLCLPNFETTSLYAQKSNFAHQANDLPSNNKENSSAKKNTLSNEYVYQFLQYDVSVPVKKIQPHFTTVTPILPNGYFMYDGHPPQICC